MEQKITIGNVCFIKTRDNSKVLLLKRAREPMKNLWTGVGGKTRFDEDIHTSCFREIKEETGLEVSELTLRGVIKTLLPQSPFLEAEASSYSSNSILITTSSGVVGRGA